MEIREVAPEELDYVAMLCVDPGISPKMREAMQPAMEVRKEWLKTMMRRGLQVSVALEKSEGVRNKKIKELTIHGNVPRGLIEYVPIELAPEPVKGTSSLFINCLWVLPPFWHVGLGQALLERVVEKARRYGGASVLAYERDKWFSYSFDYMPMSFFKKFGFEEVCRDRSRVLLHLNLGADEMPTLISPKARKIKKCGRMVVDVFFSSQCPWSGWMLDKVKQKMKKFNAVVNAISTDDRKVIEEYGISRGVSINGAPVIKRMASWKEIESVVKQARLH